MNSMTTLENVKQKHKNLFSKQNEWLPAWKELRTYFAPMRGFFDGDQANDGKMYDTKKVLNDTGIKAAGDMSAGLSAGMTSPSQPWFSLSMENQKLNNVKPVKVWLKEVQDLLYGVFKGASVYTSLDWLYLEFGAFGTGALMILEDYDKSIKLHNYTIGEYALAANASGVVDTWARQWSMTVKQLVDRFGFDNVSLNVQTMYTENRTDEFIKVNHLIIPNDGAIHIEKRYNTQMPFSSLYWETSDNNESFLEVSGFEEFPVLTPRWHLKNSTTVYGYGPGWQAYGDTKMVQRMEKDKLKGLQKEVDPPILVDANIRNRVNLLPGGVTTYDSMSGANLGVKPAYQVNLNLDHLDKSIERVERRVQRAFFTDLFLMITNRTQQKTATEVNELSEEKRILGPVLERMDSEILTPLINRTINIMARQGKLPEPPPELEEGEEINIEYVSILAKAQKALRTVSVDQLINFIAGLGNLDPSVLDKIDFDKAIEEYANMIDVPPSILRDQAEVSQIRKQRQQAQQQQQQAEQVSGAIAGAKTLSETQIGEQNGIEKITEMTGNKI